MDSLAFYIPVNVVCDLVGINGVTSTRMKDWSEALFNSTGPISSELTMSNMAAMSDFMSFLAPLSRGDLKSNSWADQLFQAAERGDITETEAKGLIADYIVPSLDTTAQSIAELLFQLAKNPDAFTELKRNPALISSAVLEAVRLATPIRGFTRYATEDITFDGAVLPKDSRVWLLNAAANLDERQYAKPEYFDIERNPRDLLAWGSGVHLCIGKHLAIMEMESLLKALVQHVKRIEINTSERLLNNMIQGYKSLRLSLYA
jgi:cytochrome P450